MSYTVNFEGRALQQLHGLPTEAFDALVERVLELLDAPWDAVIMSPGNNPAYRRAVFGGGYGLIIFHVDDQAELIRIFDLAWIG